MKQNKIEFSREFTIDWLQNMKNTGAFESFYEEDLNFENLCDSELEWYFVEWIDDDEKIKEA